MRSKSGMISICEFPTFIEDADKLMTDKEKDNLFSLLAQSPEAGSIIPGTGGIRKIRIGLSERSKGKRGGGRVVYYYRSEHFPIALIAVYAKGEKIDLSQNDKKELRALVKEYASEFFKIHEKKCSFRHLLGSLQTTSKIENCQLEQA